MKRRVSIVALMLVAAALLNSVVLATHASAQTYQGCDPGEVCE